MCIMCCQRPSVFPHAGDGIGIGDDEDDDDVCFKWHAYSK